MRRFLRTAFALPFALAVLTPLASRDDSYAQAPTMVRSHTVPGRVGAALFRPEQSNPTPDNTATATPTAQPTSSPTATAIPTATPVATNPAASSLIAHARAALKAANTSHFKLRETVDLAGLLKGTLREQGDMAQRPSEVAVHITGALTALGKPQKVDERHVQIGKQAWVKSAKTHGVWKAEKPTSPNSSGSIQNPLDLVKGKGIKITDLKTIAAEKFGSVPVWHIHGTVIAQVTQTTTTTGTVDYLIAQSGNLPYRIAEYVSDPKDGVLLDLRATFSRFGKKVTIATPKIGSALR